MGFDDYDNWWADLEAVGKKYGYQIGSLYNIDSEEDTIVVKFHKAPNCDVSVFNGDTDEYGNNNAGTSQENQKNVGDKE